jgi:hypothetical protein
VYDNIDHCLSIEIETQQNNILLPLNKHREELNTVGSYKCSLAQKSANTNWLARLSYWHKPSGSKEV